MLQNDTYDDGMKNYNSLLLQRNWFLGLLIAICLLSIIVILYIIMRYKSKFKLSKDIVRRDQATKFVKIVREINGQERKCEVAIAKGYCPKKSCMECTEKDDIDEEVAKTILIYIPKGVTLDEATERKLNLLAMSEDMRNYNCFTNINPCKEKCLDETTNTSLTSIQPSILKSSKKSEISILPSSKKSDSTKI